MIGIVGGVGPRAGLDLMGKLVDQTLAGSDQDHVDTLLYSLPSVIPDRTEYLLGRVHENPGIALAEILLRMAYAGVTVAGIPCNTAHAAPIFNVIRQRLQDAGSSLKLLHMIDETMEFLMEAVPGADRIGVLSTTGTYRTGIYRDALQARGLIPVLPPGDMQENLIHTAIYDPGYGIKSVPDRIHPQARKNLDRGFSWLAGQGARAVILGCTEIPLAFTAQTIRGMRTIDPAVALARALIRAEAPEKLKPLSKQP
jgi:aspartate racemase